MEVILTSGEISQLMYSRFYRVVSDLSWCICLQLCCYELTGGRLNKKDGLTRYGDSHVKDKTS